MLGSTVPRAAFRPARASCQQRYAWRAQSCGCFTCRVLSWGTCGLEAGFSSDGRAPPFWGARAASVHVCAQVHDLILHGCWLRRRRMATPGSVHAGIAINMSGMCLELFSSRELQQPRTVCHYHINMLMAAVVHLEHGLPCNAHRQTDSSQIYATLRIDFGNTAASSPHLGL